MVWSISLSGGQMADPLTLGTMGVAAAGGIVQGIGARFSGEAQGAAYRYKAGVALLNKQINEQNANWALESGDIKSMEEGLKAGEEIGQNTRRSGSVRYANAGGAVCAEHDQLGCIKDRVGI